MYNEGNMPKVQFSDVVPPEKRSIRNIPIPSSGRRKAPIIIKPEPISQKQPDYTVAAGKISDFQRPEETHDMRENKAYEYYYPKESQVPKVASPVSKGGKRKYLFFGASGLLVAAFLVAMMTVFASATVSITPKTQALDVTTDILATVEASEKSVRYEILKLTKSKTVSVPALGEESVEKEARGKIMIYNNFSAEPQRLIVRTRFETPEGLIYRIPESVVVPGKTSAGPGSVEVEVVADEPGDKYNIKKTDFTIPGFKNDAERYKSFYARSVTEMAGGFVGKMKTVKEEDKKVAFDQIESETKSALEQELRSKIPSGLVLLPNALVYESKELPQVDESVSVTLGREVTAYAVLLNATDLSNRIIEKYISSYPEWQSIKSSVQDFAGLQITKKPERFAAPEKIELAIAGKAGLVAEIDNELIGEKLVGMPKKEVTKIMDEFAGISSITVTIRPIWKQSFPSDPLKIKVKTTNRE